MYNILFDAGREDLAYRDYGHAAEDEVIHC